MMGTMGPRSKGLLLLLLRSIRIRGFHRSLIWLLMCQIIAARRANRTHAWRRFTRAARNTIDDEIQRTSSQKQEFWLNKGALESVDPEWLARRTRGREIVLGAPNAPAHYIELLADQ